MAWGPRAERAPLSADGVEYWLEADLRGTFLYAER